MLNPFLSALTFTYFFNIEKCQSYCSHCIHYAQKKDPTQYTSDSLKMPFRLNYFIKSDCQLSLSKLTRWFHFDMQSHQRVSFQLS